MNDYEIQKIRDTSFCSGYNTAVSKYEKQNKELQQENAELKKELVEKGQHLDLTEKEWGKDLVQMYHFKTLYTKQTDQLTKAKEIIREFIELLNEHATEYQVCMCRFSANDFIEKAEAFLKEEA